MIKNKVTLITGGSKGIGLGIAEALLEEGGKVAITGRNGKTLDEALRYLNGKGYDKVLGIVSDVSNVEDELEANEKVLSYFGSLDVLIANAGIGHFGHIQDLSFQQWKDTIDINLTGVFNSVKANLDSLTKTKGYIITIASLAGTNFFAGGTAYNASKFGLVGFTQALMLDVRHQGIKVSTIMPGSVSTYFNNRIPSEMDAWKIQPEDIGKIVVDLLTMHPRTLPSKVEVRPSVPPKK